jgi:hypothetical protein
MNTAGASKATEGATEQQQFLQEIRKLEDTARQFQSEVGSTFSGSYNLIEQICRVNRDPGRAAQGQEDQFRDKQ